MQKKFIAFLSFFAFIVCSMTGCGNNDTNVDDSVVQFGGTELEEQVISNQVESSGSQNADGSLDSLKQK